jgi:hypothetical protein
MNTHDNLRLRLIKAHKFTITAGQTTSSDWLIPQATYFGNNVESRIDGAQYCCENSILGDYMTFQIVDVDDILGQGAGTVLDEFADVYVLPGNHHIKEYAAKLIPGLYVRVTYTSTGSEDVTVVCNLDRHITVEP